MESVIFPKTIIIDSTKAIVIDLSNPFTNIIKIDNVDYIPYYLDNQNPGNKGANSNIIKLVNAQYFDKDEGYPKTPDLILKICKKWHSKIIEDNRSAMFKREIDALIRCNLIEMSNVVKIINYGRIHIKTFKGHDKEYWFYTMPWAPFDLTSYLELINPGILDKVDLCIELCNSLNQLFSLDYYHRDIKPDNILFTEDQWVISDLGLIENRLEDIEELKKAQWIGPRGFMSPEAMNKFLCDKTPWEGLFNRKIDHQSDIFQLGKVFWYIFQGNTPEGAIRRKDFLIKHDGIYQIIRRMINHKKSSRYYHIKDVIIDLKKVSYNFLLRGEPLRLY